MGSRIGRILCKLNIWHRWIFFEHTETLKTHQGIIAAAREDTWAQCKWGRHSHIVNSEVLLYPE